MSLVDIVDNSRTDKNTVHSYLPLYESLLCSKKETATNVLEIGICHGGSIKLWGDYFSKATVYGVDIWKAEQMWGEIVNKPNIKLYTRENKGYDFGAYSYVIDKLKVYDYYFFMNTSVKGPFLKNNDKWYNKFLPLFNDNVHLVGTSINICTSKIYCVDSDSKIKPHVQSMFFCLDQKYFNELKDENFFNESKINNMTFTELIRNKEVNEKKDETVVKDQPAKI